MMVMVMMVVVVMVMVVVALMVVVMVVEVCASSSSHLFPYSFFFTRDTRFLFSLRVTRNKVLLRCCITLPPHAHTDGKQ